MSKSVSLIMNEKLKCMSEVVNWCHLIGGEFKKKELIDWRCEW